MASVKELDAMRRAITVSAYSLGQIGITPPAGCVILDAHYRVVGEGYQEQDGGSPLEINALAVAGDQARGGTAVLTLEPSWDPRLRDDYCQAFSDAGIRRILIALLNPTLGDPGEVAAALKLYGFHVETGVLSNEARLTFEPWLMSLNANRPFVIWPYIYDSSGALVALELSSNPQCLAEVSRLTLSTDAILYLNGRVKRTTPLDPYSRSSQKYAELAASGPRTALRTLYRDGVHSIMLSGGRELARPFLALGLVDEILAYLAPDKLSYGLQDNEGGASARFLPAGFHLAEVARIGYYVRARGRPDNLAMHGRRQLHSVRALEAQSHDT